MDALIFAVFLLRSENYHILGSLNTEFTVVATQRENCSADVAFLSLTVFELAILDGSALLMLH